MAGRRQQIAHLFTPWEWQSRRAVLVLVVSSLVMLSAVVAAGLLTETGRPVWARAFNTAFGIVWVGLLWVRPAIRSLRRWDALHE